MKLFVRWRYELGTHAKGRLRLPVLLEHVCDEDTLFRGGLRCAHSTRRAWPAQLRTPRWVLGTLVAVKISIKSSTRLRVEDTANGGDIVVDHVREEFVEKSRGRVLPLDSFMRVHRRHRIGGRCASAIAWIHAAYDFHAEMQTFVRDRV